MQSADQTKILVLAPAELYRHAWQSLLAAQPFLSVEQTVPDIEGVFSALERLSITAVLIDMPGAELAAVRRLKPEVEHAGLLVVVDDYQLSTVLPLLRIGATGCIARSDSVANLARSIIAVGRGEIALPSSIAGRALAALVGGELAPAEPAEELTDREGEVLSLLAAGMTNKDIAQTLFLSVRTIEAHLRGIFGKLGVSSRTEAALWAVKNGFAPLE